MKSIIEDFESIHTALKQLEAEKSPPKAEVSEGTAQDWTDVEATDGGYSAAESSDWAAAYWVWKHANVC